MYSAQWSELYLNELDPFEKESPRCATDICTDIGGMEPQTLS